MNRTFSASGEYKNIVSLSDLNHAVHTDPKGFVSMCESVYTQEILLTADRIIDNISRSRIVMLAGPSGSGKTTSAQRIRACLEKRGIRANAIEMDRFFLDVDREDKTLDYEAPERIDIPLMIEQMEKLARGEEVWLPQFDFVTGKQYKNVTHMQLHKDEIAIFEGIHALNDIFRKSKAEPFDLYVSPRLRITDENDKILIRPDEMRFLRRGIRDMKYRGADFNRTLELWGNVMTGVEKYIMPFRKYADKMIDTSFAYEVNLLAPFALPCLAQVDEETMLHHNMASLAERLCRFEPIDPCIVPADSMLREFIGQVDEK